MLRLVSASLVWALSVSAVGVASAQPQEFMTPWGRASVRVPNPVTAGNWEGSWIYADRDRRMALFLRDQDGQIQARVQYQSLSTPEVFETDWSGEAAYYLSGSPVEFRFHVDSADENEILGNWFWNVEFSDSGRSERGTFRVYRIDYGRDLALVFRDWERVVRSFDRVSRWDNPPLWIFTKASRRIVTWDELPF
jgi:hypothetical protein